MNLITVHQIKAARALLGWNQQDLADAANMSKPALANLERYTSSPRVDTIESITKALESAGIEFTDGPGLKLRREVLRVEIFEGEDSMSRLWNDILDTLKEGDTRLVSNMDEKRIIKVVGNRYQKILDKYKVRNIKGKLLCCEGNKNFLDDNSEYRWVSKDLFKDIPYTIYGDKYAVFLWEPSLRIVVIENKIITDNYREQFNRRWEKAIIPK